MDKDVTLCKDGGNKHKIVKNNKNRQNGKHNHNVNQSPISPIDFGATQDNASKNDENIAIKDHSFKHNKQDDK